MGYTEDYVKELNQGYEDERNDPKYKGLYNLYRKEPVTGKTIKQEHEQPWKNLADLTATALKYRAVWEISKQGDYIRRRTQQFPFTGGSDPLIDVKATKTKTNYSDIIDNVLARTDKGLLKEGTGVNDPNVYISPQEAARIGLNQPFQSIIDNYKPSLPELPDEGTPKPVIPKSTEYIENKLFKGQSGYKTLADYKANVLNKIPWETRRDFYGQVFRNLQEGERFYGYAEHKIAKSSEKGREIRYNELADKGSVKPIRDSDISYDMDWYHDKTYYDKPWHKGGTLRSDGLNKGDRNRFENMILGFNPRLKTVKDQVEPIVYGTMINPGPGMLNPDLKSRIIVTVEDPQENIAREDRTNLGRIVLQRAGDDKVVGYIGQHWDAFYPYDSETKDILINGLIERGYINNPSELGDWREAKLRERINFIIEQAPDLNQIELDKGSATRQKILEAALRKDLVEFRKEFGWIPVQKNLKRKLNTEFSQEGYGWLKQDIPPESIKTKPKESPIKSWHDPSIKERHTYGGYIRRSKQPRTAKEWVEKLFPRQFKPVDDE